MRSLVCLLLMGSLFLAQSKKNTAEQGVRLQGTPGSSQQWGSGWLNLNPPMSFHKGDRLKLSIGGSRVRRVIVRLLGATESAETSAGAIPEPKEVKQGLVEVVLDEDYPNIKQISVHGGTDLWNGAFNLGSDNGPATLNKVVLVRASH
jgi:hypothetical protein